jgi:hypothetical protein
MLRGGFTDSQPEIISDPPPRGQSSNPEPNPIRIDESPPPPQTDPENPHTPGTPTRLSTYRSDPRQPNRIH